MRTVFNLNAGAMRITQPNGKSVVLVGLRVHLDDGRNSLRRRPCVPPLANCPTAQIARSHVDRHRRRHRHGECSPNGLPAAAGNTSILFPGFQVCAGTREGERHGIC